MPLGPISKHILSRIPNLLSLLGKSDQNKSLHEDINILQIALSIKKVAQSKKVVLVR
jgi:hypothetical protein